MERFKSLFSHSFNQEAIEAAFNILDIVKTKCADEFFIILNDYKRALNINDGNGNGADIYQGDNVRSRLVNEVNTDCLKDMSSTSNEYKIMAEVCVIIGMVERIEQHLLNNSDEYKLIFDMFGKSREDVNMMNGVIAGGARTDWSEFSIAYDNDSHEIVLKPGVRDLTLIVIVLILFTMFEGDEWVFEFYKHINVHYHHGRPLAASQEFDQPSLNKSIQEDEITTGMSPKEINGRVFRKFHSLIHTLNKGYNVRTLSAQFALVQVWSLIKSLIILNRWNGTTDYIDSSVLMDKEEYECELIHNGIEAAFSNILICSIYAFNGRYGWFDMDKFNRFVSFYGNSVKTLSVFIMDREKYATLYGLGVLYALRYANISLSNTIWTNVQKMKIEEIGMDFLSASNRAMLFTVPDTKIPKKLNYYVLEVQDRVMYVSNEKNAQGETVDSRDINSQVMNYNNNYIDSFVIYNILKPELNNLEYICYDIEDLKKLLKEYKEGKRDMVMNRNQTAKVEIDPQISLMEKEVNFNSLVLKIIGFTCLIAVIVFVVYESKNKDLLKWKPTVYDKSLW